MGFEKLAVRVQKYTSSLPWNSMPRPAYNYGRQPLHHDQNLSIEHPPFDGKVKMLNIGRGCDKISALKIQSKNGSPGHWQLVQIPETLGYVEKQISVCRTLHFQQLG